MHRYKIK